MSETVLAARAVQTSVQTVSRRVIEELTVPVFFAWVSRSAETGALLEERVEGPFPVRCSYPVGERPQTVRWQVTDAVAVQLPLSRLTDGRAAVVEVESELSPELIEQSVVERDKAGEITKTTKRSYRPPRRPTKRAL